MQTRTGATYSNRLFGLRRQDGSYNQEFARLCADIGIRYRLGLSADAHHGSPAQWSAIRLDAVLQGEHFRKGERTRGAVLRLAQIYNTALVLGTLKGKTPIGSQEEWMQRRPDLLKRQSPLNAVRTAQYTVPASERPHTVLL